MIAFSTVFWTSSGTALLSSVVLAWIRRSLMNIEQTTTFTQKHLFGGIQHTFVMIGGRKMAEEEQIQRIPIPIHEDPFRHLDTYVFVLQTSWAEKPFIQVSGYSLWAYVKELIFYNRKQPFSREN